MPERDRFEDDENEDSSRAEEVDDSERTEDEGRIRQHRDDSESNNDEEKGKGLTEIEMYDDEIEPLTGEDDDDDQNKSKEDKGGLFNRMFSTDEREKEIDEPMSPGDTYNHQNDRSKKRKKRIIIAIILLVVVAIAVFLGLLLSGKESEVLPREPAAEESRGGMTPSPSQSIAPSSLVPESSSVPTPSPAPTAKPTALELLTEDELFDFIANYSLDEGASMNDLGSPQNAAFTWLKDVDQFWRVGPTQTRRLMETPQDKYHSRVLQRYRMMSFYFGSNGGMWKNPGDWGHESKDECSWQFYNSEEWQIAIVCSQDRMLFELSLIGNHVTGIIVPELGQMEQLKMLVIDNDDNEGVGLTGGLPESFRMLPSMETFKVVGNHFTDPLAEDFFVEWSSIETLNLARNNIAGYLPAASFATLSSLKRLQLGGNYFEGPIPPEIQGMSSLELLALGNNNLSDDLPTQLYALSKLSTLQLKNNSFTGSFPDVSQMTGLTEELTLDDNKFSGVLPHSFHHVPELKILSIANNDFYGPVPDLTPLTKLREFDFSGNPGLSGDVPVMVCDSIESRDGFGRVDCGTMNPECPSNPIQHVCCLCCTCDLDEAPSISPAPSGSLQPSLMPSSEASISSAPTSSLQPSSSPQPSASSQPSLSSMPSQSVQSRER